MNGPNHAVQTAARLSRRAESLGTENAFVVLAEVNALVRQGKDIVSFCIGQPDFPTPENVRKAGIAGDDDELVGEASALTLNFIEIEPGGRGFARPVTVRAPA